MNTTRSNTCAYLVAAASLMVFSGACDPAIVDEPELGDEVDSDQSARVIDIDEIAPELSVTEYDDGRFRYLITGVEGARVLLDLVESGEVEMEPDIFHQLRVDVTGSGDRSSGLSPRQYQKCPNAGTAKAVAQRLWFGMWGGWHVHALAEWKASGFSPQLPARAEAVVCANGCSADVKVGTTVQASAKQVPGIGSNVAAYASAKVENTGQTCYFALAAEYWPPGT